MECCDVGEVLECYETNGVQENADMHLQDMEKYMLINLLCTSNTATDSNNMHTLVLYFVPC
jgi:hypothetical protein